MNSRFLKVVQAALLLFCATFLANQRSHTLASAANHISLDDGRYLYGQRPIAAQPGSTYLVFEVVDDKTVGAFYMPQSSFDCFHGEVSGRQLELTVLDSYEQTTYDYSLPIQPQSELVAGQGAPTLSIAGLRPINDLSNLDRRILQTCRQVQPEAAKTI